MAKKTTKKHAVVAHTEHKAVTPETLFEYLELVHVRLLESGSRLHISDRIIPTVAKIETNSSLSPDVDSNTLSVNTLVTVAIRPANGEAVDEKSSSVNITATYQCLYAVQNTEIDNLKQHANLICSNGIFVSWPYIRELVQSLTLRMGIPPFVIPLVRADARKLISGVKKIENKKKAKIAPKKRAAKKKRVKKKVAKKQ